MYAGPLLMSVVMTGKMAAGEPGRAPAASDILARSSIQALLS